MSSSSSFRRSTGLVAPIVLAGLFAIASCQERFPREEGPPPGTVGYEQRPKASACHAPSPSPLPAIVTRVMEPLVFEQPTAMVPGPDQDTWYVLERKGVLVRAHRSDSGWTSSVALDIQARTETQHFEAGLLAFVLSPDFAKAGEAFLMFTAKGDEVHHTSVLSRIRSDDGGLTFTLPQDHSVLELRQTVWGHYGGGLHFGPDRFLYYLVGDGWFGDPEHRAQNPDELFGKVLRLDVLAARPYAIPPDNPFARGGGRPEIYALGFRNPWSGSFDEQGRLWVGDVGHDRWEEIDIVTKGGNYGWPVFEGTDCFEAPSCELAGTIAPAFQYPHTEGFCVVAGALYRGDRIPDLRGRFVFGDCVNGRIWALEPTGPESRLVDREIAQSQLTLVSLVEGLDRELYAIDHVSGLPYRLDASEPRPEVEASLGSLGCLDRTSEDGMEMGLIPYEVNAALWSDGLEKRRWLSVPEGAAIHVNEDGDWDLPPGSIALKTFLYEGRPVETRMLAREGDQWRGYAFEWNEAGDDATLLVTGKTVELGDRTWNIPGRGDCPACHTSAAGRTLGLETAQLNRELVYPTGRRANQLATLEHIGMFDAPLPETRPRLAEPFLPAEPLEDRARAYLHANCAGCHRPLGPGRGAFDLRATLSRDEMNLVCASPSTRAVDLEDGLVVAPGEPDQSVLLARMARRGPGQMPPLGTLRADEAGIALVREWVTSITSCSSELSSP